MFNRFTDRARKVLVLAQQEAARFGHGYIGTEHLLLGLLHEGEGVAAKALSSLNIDISAVRAQVEEILGQGQENNAEMGYTPRAKKVIEMSMEEALRLEHNYVGTEHILLGLIREGEGVAAQVLTSMGVDIAQMRKKVIEYLGGYSGKNISHLKNHPGIKADAKTTTPLIDEFGRDLSKLSADGKLDPVIGRDKEIERVIQILLRRTKNNPVLIGEPGVGKTAIAEGLANHILQGKIPEILTNKRIISLSMASIVAGTKYRGEFEERMKKILAEAKEDSNIILFIDELHTLIGAGAAEGAVDAANIIKPLLTRGELQVIGATTLDEYKKYIERDAALERRFQPIMVEEPTPEDSIAILKGIRDKYEAFHRAQITDEAIETAVKLSHRYISDRFLPDKAIDLMDEAASRVRLQSSMPAEVKNIQSKLEKTKAEKESAIAAQEFERAAALRDMEQKVSKELADEQKRWKIKGSERIMVTAEDIAHVVSIWTGIPLKRLTGEESERLLKMEDVLHQRVVGQLKAVEAVARAVRRARAGLKDPKRPIGSFIFLGPTGVGKTELARALAEALFGDETAMIRLDMSEYMEKHTVSRMLGAPPGYVGHEEGGQLTDAVRRKPYSVILFDEIEKAHYDVFNMLLQVLEDGRLTDSKGRTTDFKNTVIIMTSNVGSQHLKKDASSLGFVKDSASLHDRDEVVKNRVLDEVKKTFRPEFLNRVDEIIVFNSLSDEELTSIVEIMLKDVTKRLTEVNLALEISDAAKKELLKEGRDHAFGARPLRRAIQKLVEDEVSEMILGQHVSSGDIVTIDVGKDGKFTFSKKGCQETASS